MNILFEIILEFIEVVEIEDKDVGVIRVKIILKVIGMDEIIYREWIREDVDFEFGFVYYFNGVDDEDCIN